MGTLNDLEQWDVANKLDGAEEVAPTTRRTRFEICVACPELNDWQRCKLCNCWMPVKARLPFFSCPIGKW